MNLGCLRSHRSQSGLTLMELLAAMAIFLGLAGMVLQVLGGGLDLWTTGERTRDNTERAGALLDHLAYDLRHLQVSDSGEGEPRIKLYSDWIDTTLAGKGVVRSQRLLFVRYLYEERTQPFLRNAGSQEFQGNPGEYYYGKPPEQEGLMFRATEGMAEIAWLTLPDLRKGYEGRMVLWRALRSPIGGPGNLFESIDEQSGGLDDYPMDPLAENVLHLGFEFIDSRVTDLEVQGGLAGPSPTWDSTRGILPSGDGPHDFRHAKGQESLAERDDDVFPQAVRITVVLAPPPGEQPAPQLMDELTASRSASRAELAGGRVLRSLGAGKLRLKLDYEWIEVAPTDGTSLVVVQRGLYSTAVARHEVGTEVRFGREFQRIVRLPVSRDDLSPDERRTP